MNLSKGQYWDQSWSPIRGCSHASPGCNSCWAERMAGRFCGDTQDPRIKDTSATFYGFAARGTWTGRVDLIESELQKPLHWKRPRVVALNWMGDLFHERVPFEDIMRTVRVMQQAYWHKYLILTKRSTRLLEFTRWMGAAEHWVWPLWCALGVSVEDQQRANERIPDLLATPAAMRFMSGEPLLGTIKCFPDGAFTEKQRFPAGFDIWTDAKRDEWFKGTARATYMSRQTGIDWVIVGGESGPGARPCDVAWVRSIVAQCKAAGTKCFVKQLGANPTGWKFPNLPDAEVAPLRDRKGADASEWPEDLRVRELPEWMGGKP